jgi:hypothetical protein
MRLWMRKAKVAGQGRGRKETPGKVRVRGLIREVCTYLRGTVGCCEGGFL